MNDQPDDNFDNVLYTFHTLISPTTNREKFSTYTFFNCDQKCIYSALTTTPPIRYTKYTVWIFCSRQNKLLLNSEI